MQRRRHPGERDRRYLAALIEWGYKPSDVEQLVLTPPPTAPTDAPTDDTASVPADAGDLDAEVLDTGDAEGFEDAEGFQPEAGQDYGDV